MSRESEEIDFDEDDDDTIREELTREQRERYEKDPVIQERLERLKVIAEGYTRGDMIPRDVFEREIGFDWSSNVVHYLRILLRKHLQNERHITCRIERMRGLVLMTSSETARHEGEGRNRKIKNQCKKAKKALTTGLDVSELTDRERLQVRMRLESFDDTVARMRKAQFEVRSVTPERSMRETLIEKSRQFAAADRARREADMAARMIIPSPPPAPRTPVEPAPAEPVVPTAPVAAVAPVVTDIESAA